MSDKGQREHDATFEDGGDIADRVSELSAFIGAQFLILHDGKEDIAVESQDTVVALSLLHRVADYRGVLRRWFGGVRIGGNLILTVPHTFESDREQLIEPARNKRPRPYSPGSLLREVEEALAPATYRVRQLEDGRGQRVGAGEHPTGGIAGEKAETVLVLEKLSGSSHCLEVSAPTPDYLFEPLRTRVEVGLAVQPRTVLVMKLDHLGDFILGLGALETLRTLLPQSRITLVVGSWNAETARELDIADEVIAFDAFPRNSSEEEVNVPARAAIFEEAVAGRYDLAIDLRTDHDTRFLLKHVDAGLRAGIGTRNQFPFLDIFLPIDLTRNEPETARELRYSHETFSAQGGVVRHPHRFFSDAKTAERDCAIVWGPYHHLRAGRYVFEPYLEFDSETNGTLLLDVGLDADRVAQVLIPGSGSLRLPFTVERPNSRFEFRIWTVDDLPAIDFSFFGGRLVRAGANSVLHQSEYMMLLVYLVSMRLQRSGVLSEVALG